MVIYEEYKRHNDPKLISTLLFAASISGSVTAVLVCLSLLTLLP